MAEKKELAVTEEKVVEIEMERLRSFENHPFKVRADSQMIELQESVKKYGILNPLIVRPRKDGTYEIISGHRRKFAAEKIGYRKVPVIITTIEDCKDLEFELMENDNVYLNRVLGKLWNELEAKQNEIEDTGLQETGELQSDIVEEFRSKTDELFHEVDGQSAGDIEKMVATYVQEKIEEEMLDVEIVDVVLSGSRCRGLEKKDSDLDVVVEYKGSIREDDFFKILHEDDYEISGIKVDINPITEGKTGKLETYLPGVEEYLREKEMERNERKSVREKIRENKSKISVNSVSTEKDKVMKNKNVR